MGLFLGLRFVPAGLLCGGALLAAVRRFPGAGFGPRQWFRHVPFLRLRRGLLAPDGAPSVRLDPVRGILFPDGPGLDSGDFPRSEASNSIDFDFNETVNVSEFMSVANVGSFVTLFKKFLRKVAMLGLFVLGFGRSIPWSSDEP